MKSTHSVIGDVCPVWSPTLELFYLITSHVYFLLWLQMISAVCSERWSGTVNDTQDKLNEDLGAAGRQENLRLSSCSLCWQSLSESLNWTFMQMALMWIESGSVCLLFLTHKQECSSFVSVFFFLDGWDGSLKQGDACVAGNREWKGELFRRGPNWEWWIEERVGTMYEWEQLLNHVVDYVQSMATHMVKDIMITSSSGLLRDTLQVVWVFISVAFADKH